MIDTVTFRATGEQGSYTHVIDALTAVVHHEADGVGYDTGRLDNLYVRVTPCTCTVTGSLPMFLSGSNVETFTRQRVLMAMTIASDMLGVDLDAADVTRLDVAATLPMEHEPREYYQYMGILRGATRSTRGSSLYYYKRGHDGLCFYDKEREAHLSDGRHLLRYEARYTGNLCRSFGVSHVTGADLLEGDFYRAAVERWRQDYDKITKIRTVDNIDFRTMNSVKALRQAGVAFLCQAHGGMLAMMDKVDSAARQGILTRKQAHDMKAAIRVACTEHRDEPQPADGEAMPMIDELSHKVDDVAERAAAE